MTQNNIRRKTLRKDEPLYRQQAPYLQRMGRTRASKNENDDTADKLRDLDLLAWDETERYLSHFSEDLENAPYVVTDLLAETASLGRTIGMEVELPPLIAALTFVRIMAGGDEVFEKHKPIWIAIMRSQDLDPQARPLFEKYCREINANKLDPSTGKETIYRRGDPMERAKNTEEAKMDSKIEELLGKILEATKGWNCKDAFGDYWEQWTELWAHLLEQDKQGELFEKLSQKSPKSNGNSTSINIKLVCNVAGLMKRHLEKSPHHAALTNTSFANYIKDAWSSDSCRTTIDKTTEITDKVSQINGWLAMNLK